MALAHVGVTGRIEDVDNENSPEAVNCRIFFDHVVALVLEACEWPFAMIQDNLANIGDPPDSWLFRYKYPANARIINRIINPAVRTPGEDQQVPFIIRKQTDGYGKVILCDLENAVVEYNDDITDTGLFSSSFAQAVALGVAAHIAAPLRVDPRIQQSATTNFNTWLAEAITVKQREQQNDPEPDSQMFAVRN
jgi:hypothetical protein